MLYRHIGEQIAVLKRPIPNLLYRAGNHNLHQVLHVLESLPMDFFDAVFNSDRGSAAILECIILDLRHCARNRDRETSVTVPPNAVKTALNTVTVELDYPDVRLSMEDVIVTGGADQRIVFPEQFPHAIKAINITLQDPPGTVTAPATAYIRGKDVTGFDLRLLDTSGAIVSGLVDVVAVGY